MKKTITLVCLLFVTTIAFSTPMTLDKLPKTPPPYGVYYLDTPKSTNAELYANQEKLARFYGFKSWDDALSACINWNRSVPVEKRVDCAVDAVRHLRDKVAEAEIKKYGFKNWQDASDQCIRKAERGDVHHCRFDPFLKLRSK